MGLEEAIKRSGYKKKWLAEQLAVAPETVGRWCKGYPVPDSRKIVISKLLGFTISEIWFGNDDTKQVARNLAASK